MTDLPETRELIQFIRQLTFDGELSVDEAWELAHFLNSHEASAAVWPGTLLVPLLQSFWADGDVDEAELSTLGQALKFIENHWAEHIRATTPVEVVAKRKRKTREPIGNIRNDSIEVSLPRIPLTAEVRSSNRDSTYLVNLSEHTCTCPDFRKRRAELPQCSPSRACKHMCVAFSDNFDQWPASNPTAQSAIGSLAEIGKGAPPDGRWSVVGGAVVCNGGGPWVNVFVDHGNGAFESFGFNKVERRWAYGIEPESAGLIEGSV